MLTLAVQKSGRLSEKTLRLLEECGIQIGNGGKGKLKAVSSTFPLEILYLRDDDIPECVADGIAHVGIVGANVVFEKDREVEIVEGLGFARCRMSIAVPKEMDYKGLADLNGLKIATSFPRILSKYLQENHVQAEIHEINGSVEIAPSIGLADVIFDIVSTGSTLLSNSLKEVETVLHSEAVLIAHPGMDAEKRALLEQLIFRIKAVLKAKDYKYILLNVPNEKIETICQILPGMKSPTVMPLAKEGWSSLHSVIREKEFWEIIERLKQNGAQGILVIPIEKMIV
ncbi:ATP phosphoribosyltransferase [Caldithrix abyssi]|uniref:ATP phosphoribosyltransferase n=1 Tax=Caldithrix abyssi DSM 13497 TaxID=880073 RepID=H1XWT2_CALAY|nr:ATP phosphoribosyltransferase [Caldithrix abyssi]APF19131.1 hisG ATP phosphoribosyltransferase [Caldithrix abyssi DSM 13497]EHO43058.1 ATP phosphoribosyltransferase [Caldithrix abyssi DSM 13497]